MVEPNAPSRCRFEYRMSEKRRESVPFLQRYCGWLMSDVSGLFPLTEVTENGKYSQVKVIGKHLCKRAFWPCAYVCALCFLKQKTRVDSESSPWRKCHTGAGKLESAQSSGAVTPPSSGFSWASWGKWPCAYRWLPVLLSWASINPIQTQAISADAMVALCRQTRPKMALGTPRAFKAASLAHRAAQVRFHLAVKSGGGEVCCSGIGWK